MSIFSCLAFQHLLFTTVHQNKNSLKRIFIIKYKTMLSDRHKGTDLELGMSMLNGAKSASLSDLRWPWCDLRRSRSLDHWNISATSTRSSLSRSKSSNVESRSESSTGQSDVGELANTASTAHAHAHTHTGRRYHNHCHYHHYCYYCYSFHLPPRTKDRSVPVVVPWCDLTMYCALCARPSLSADLSPCTGCFKLISLTLYGGPAAAVR